MINIENLLKQGEGENLEFKESFSDRVIESLVAFANMRGGNVFIGISDKGDIIGVDISKESIQNWLNEVKQKTDNKITPDVELFLVDKKQIICFSISEYPSKPVSFRGRYYIRRANSNHIMSTDEIAYEYLKIRNKSRDMSIANGVSLSDLDEQKIFDAIVAVNQQREQKIEPDILSFLKKLDLVYNDGVTHAAYLLFSKKELLEREVLIGLFEDDTLIKKSLSLKNNLVGQVEEIMDFVMAYITKEYVITGKPQRDEKWQYPITAIREFVINAIVHRNYVGGTHSQFKIFRDKLVFWNYGSLPNQLSIEDLYLGTQRS
ncbi:MAG: putative DNA binding domain-containing protein [Candidatus Absconditabacteria bacterium]|nr:putative DNA binding domain-containing protein [Candidatus Absconditabacteria bacterium]